LSSTTTTATTTSNQQPNQTIIIMVLAPMFGLLQQTDDLSKCVYTNGYQVDFLEFSCIYPALAPFYTEYVYDCISIPPGWVSESRKATSLMDAHAAHTISLSRLFDFVCFLLKYTTNNKQTNKQTNSFEKGYDPIWMVEWMSARSPWFPLTACTLYGLAILLGQAYFHTHHRWHWRTSMAFWNLALSSFSLLGMLRLTPHLLHNVTTLSWRENLCTDPQTTYGSGSTGVWVQLFVISKFPYVYKISWYRYTRLYVYTYPSWTPHIIMDTHNAINSFLFIALVFL
jgi:GNS1/SUR4 family